MDENQQVCPDCGAPYAPADNYCRQCGMFLAAARNLPAPVITTRALANRPRASLPVPVARVATAVAIGTALQVGMGLAGKYLARQAARAAISAVRPAPRPRSRVAPQRAVAAREPEAVELPATAVSETLLIRRVWMRRG